MTDREDSTDEDAAHLGTAHAERRACYPEEGFALVEIDMLKPPGEALTVIRQDRLLSELGLPATTDLRDYVIYDSAGNAYDRESLDTMIHHIEAGETEPLRTALQTEDRRQQQLALYGIAETAADAPEVCLDLLPEVWAGLDADDPAIQTASLECLCTLAEASPGAVEPDVGEVLPLLASDTDVYLRRQAIQLVATMADHAPSAVIDAAPHLGALLQEGAPEASVTAAITALHRLAAAYPDAVVPAVPDLRRYVETESGAKRTGAIAVLGMISKAYPNVAEETIPTVTECLSASDVKLRANAAGLLADLAGEYPEQVRHSVPQVIELLDDDDLKVRHNATSILARVAQAEPGTVERATGPLIEALGDEHAASRANACWALGYLEAEQALPALKVHTKEDPSEEVRQAASRAVENITGETP